MFRWREPSEVISMSHSAISREAIAVVRRNTEEVQGKGDWRVFEQLFAPDFVDHTPQPGGGADRASVRRLYQMMRTALPDWRPVIHWQAADGDLVTTYKTYHGTHLGPLLGIPPSGRKVSFETVDVRRVRNGQIIEHWGAANFLKALEQIGAWHG